MNFFIRSFSLFLISVFAFNANAQIVIDPASIQTISDPAANTSDVQSAMNNVGDAFIVWTDSTNSDVRASYSSDFGATWSSPVIIAPGVSNFRNLAVDLNDARQGVIAWDGDVGGTNVVQTANSTDGGASWPLVTTVGPNVTSKDDTQVKLDSSGTAVALWSEGFNRAFASYYNGSSWTVGAQISPGVEDVSLGGYPTTLANDGMGNFAALWRNTTQSRIECIYSTAGAWGATTTVANFGVPPGFGPTRISLDMSSSAIVVAWKNSTGFGGTTNVETSRSSDNGATWSPQSTLAFDIFLPDGNMTTKLDTQGNGFITWNGFEWIEVGVSFNGIIPIYYTTNSGNSWTFTTNLNQGLSTLATLREITFAKISGELAFIDWQGGSNDIFAAGYSTNDGQTWSGVEDIYTSPTSLAETSTAFNNSRNVIFAWYEDVGGFTVVRTASVVVTPLNNWFNLSSMNLIR